MTDNVEKRSMWIPVSKAIRDSFDAAQAARDRWEAMTPAERVEAERERQAQVARMSAAVAGLHREALASLDGKLREVIELHGPVGSVYPLCRGCDGGDDAAVWPCRTYTLVTGVDEARAQEVRKAARESTEPR